MQSQPIAANKVAITKVAITLRVMSPFSPGSIDKFSVSRLSVGTSRGEHVSLLTV
jgi:hypothetical protein